MRNLSEQMWSGKNAVDFALRKVFSWRLRRKLDCVPEQETRLAREVGEFLARFDWDSLDKPRGSSVIIADIGCRNFFLAPEIDRLFRSKGWDPHVHGFEVDAYRRLADFRTRKEYGDYLASCIPRGMFHPVDYRRWNEKVDISLLLHPFVQRRSVLAWGLPLAVLRPHQLIRHTVGMIHDGGLLLVSAPSKEELAVSVTAVRAQGLAEVGSAEWKPTARSLQKVGRVGTLFRKTPSVAPPVSQATPSVLK